MLLDKARDNIKDLRFNGKIIGYALTDKPKLAVAIADYCTPEQMKAADPSILCASIMKSNHQLSNILLATGIDVTTRIADYFYYAVLRKNAYLIEKLQNAGANINADNHRVLRYFMTNDDVASAKFLLRFGADFEGFRDHLSEIDGVGSELSEKNLGFLSSLKEYWENNIKPPEAERDEDDWELGDDD
ncbi:MAG: hypothetical protein LBN43_04110 [Oscillospiraceae bacterium]|jgi:hypothetical protein|nr:hypothetical protein [Oscillospiraceae bacterium]